MAETSEGWDGTINEAGMARILAAATAPRIVEGVAISAVPGQRRIVISPGETHQAFIRYENTDATVIDLPVPTAGRWHLVVERRDWENNAVTTIAIPAAETTTAVPTAPPASYPAELAELPGGLLDFPLYWAWVRTTDTTVVTLPIILNRPFIPQVGYLDSERSGVVAKGVNDQSNPIQMMEFTIAGAVLAGSILRIAAQVEIRLPNGNDFAGYLQIRRNTPAPTLLLRERRWHSHGRGNRWLFHTIELNYAVPADMPAGTRFSFALTNDPLSSDFIEFWYPTVSWSVS